MSLKDERKKCKVCGVGFDSKRALHAHIKSHKLFLADYYCKYYPRYNLLTGEQLPFKNREDYFVKSFSSRKQLNEWARKADERDVKKYLLSQLKNRIEARV